MSFLKILSLAFGAIVVENVVFTYAFGITSFLDASKKPRRAILYGCALTATLFISSIFSFLFDILFKALGVEYLRTIVFLLIILAASSLVSLSFKKLFGGRLSDAGGFVPLTVLNSAVFGTLLLSSFDSLSFIQTVVYAVSSGVGFTLASLLFSTVRARLEYCEIPAPFKGLPITLITAGLIALALMGFAGISFA